MQEGGLQIQKGMNFGIKKNYSIVLMSTAKNAPYADSLLEGGIIEYEGHDAIKSTLYNKKEVDQPARTRTGNLTENGKFLRASREYKAGLKEAANIKVYRKIKPGTWVDMGFYSLIDGYEVSTEKRKVFKFLLQPNDQFEPNTSDFVDLAHNRQIPGEVQREVYERDGGKCCLCGSEENLHFDHILAYSKGGSSKVSSNIRLLCAKHNLEKGAKFG